VVKRSFLLLFFVTILAVPVMPVLAGNGINQIRQQTAWSMEELAQFELKEGLAGSYFGFHGNYLIMAGGTSFPEGKPWEGGSKRFSDIVLVFERDPTGSLKLVHKSHSLPFAAGEGAAVSIPGGLLCLGGQTSGGLTAGVYLLSFDGSSLRLTEFPSLPALSEILLLPLLATVFLWLEAKAPMEP